MRRRTYVITGEMLARIFPFSDEVRRYAVLYGPPSDAICCQVFVDSESRKIFIEYEHPSFEVITEGQSAPQYDIQITWTDDMAPSGYQALRLALNEAKQLHKKIG